MGSRVGYGGFRWVRGGGFMWGVVQVGGCLCWGRGAKGQTLGGLKGSKRATLGGDNLTESDSKLSFGLEMG